jgi:uncharacterized protein YyaL (SSP411 family)
MPNRLADAVSPYLRSHAGNPVDWQQWGSEPFAEAERRQVPVLVSIGYSTCHWCHVMARESFSDPELAAYLNANFVSIKVDREEHPDVDASYLAAAGAFTEQLGWPLTVFTTPGGRAFFAGTYFPPVAGHGRASFRQVLEAVGEAWKDRRDDVEDTAARLAAALASASPDDVGQLPGEADFAAIVSELAGYEDAEFGGFGGAPKFPVATVLGLLLDREDAGDQTAGALARRTLDAMASSPLRDAVEGGFFRYATERDWSEPHYERMLYDNALLLDAYARAGRADVAEGIASFLLNVMRLPSGGFASAQDSESTVDGVRVEGGYYALDAAARAGEPRPALDEKVLTGWNGLAIGALASAGARLGHPDWIEAARAAAQLVAGEADAGALGVASGVDSGSRRSTIVRARIGDRLSSAHPTFEDYGMLADGLLSLALATGEVRHAKRARSLLAAVTTSAGFAVPEGPDPVLAQHGLALAADPSEGAYPSGLSAAASAAVRLYLLGGDRGADLSADHGGDHGADPSGDLSGDHGGDHALLDLARRALEPVAALALGRPIAFGAALGVMSALDAAPRQLVVVTEDPDAELATIARAWPRGGGLVSVVTPRQAAAFAAAGFELYEGRALRNGLPAAYLCEDFLCRRPVTDPAELTALLVG